MVTLEAVREAATELRNGNGKQLPSLRIALWAAVLSPRNDLENNGLQVDNLRPYAFGGLPHDIGQVRHLIGLRPARKCTRVQAQAVIAVDTLVTSGELDNYRNMPRTVQAWLLWRAGIARLYGMSWKTASFAALLLWPFECPFVPVDCHVAARLGHMDVFLAGKLSRKSKAGYRAYRAVEREVYAEWRQAGKPVPLALWHWFKWEQDRTQDSGQLTLWTELDTVRVGTHVLLSPYLYYVK